MTLNFTKKSHSYVAEFETSGDFNLHIEGVAEGNVRVFQRTTADGEYALVKSAQFYPSGEKVYDCDFSALIYPKYIKVTCDAMPTKAEATFA